MTEIVKGKDSKLGSRRARKQDSSRVEKNEAYQERRDEILEVARKLFIEKGFDNTSLGDIAQVMNADRATLYYYISSKEEMFYAIVGRIAETNVLEIEGIAAGIGSPSERLQNAMMSLNRSYKEAYPLLQMYLNDYVSHVGGRSTDDRKDDWSVRYYHAIRSILQQGVDQGEFVLTLPIGMTALGLIGMINWSQAVSLGSTKNSEAGRLSPDAVGAGFAQLVFSGILRK